MIGSAPFNRLSQKPDMTIFAATLYDINKALAPKKEIDPATIVPPQYHEFLSVFSREEAAQLPPHRPYDHRIPLEEGKVPPFGPLYGMSCDELLILKEYLESNLKKGFI